MPWILLILAGGFEVVWAAALPSTNGFTRPIPTALFVVGLLASMVLLARAVETIPLGTGYAVWVGIGVIGAAIVGIVGHGEPASPARIAFLMLLIVAITGLKLTSD